MGQKADHSLQKREKDCGIWEQREDKNNGAKGRPSNRVI